MKGSRTRSVPRSMMGDRQRLTGSSYLRECLKKQREVAKALFNQDQDLRNIEDLAADIRLGSNLTYENVRMITGVGLWSGRGFWQWPNADEFNDRLEQHPVGDLSTELPEREEHIVDQLLGVFRHRVRLFFVGGRISLCGSEAGGNWIRHGVVREQRRGPVADGTCAVSDGWGCSAGTRALGGGSQYASMRRRPVAA